MSCGFDAADIIFATEVHNRSRSLVSVIINKISARTHAQPSTRSECIGKKFPIHFGATVIDIAF